MIAGESPSSLARELGVARSQLYSWTAEYQRRGEQAFPNAEDALSEAVQAALPAENEEKLARLQHKLRQQEIEIEYLQRCLQFLSKARVA
jgi:transposase-like protein